MRLQGIPPLKKNKASEIAAEVNPKRRTFFLPILLASLPLSLPPITAVIPKAVMIKPIFRLLNLYRLSMNAPRYENDPNRKIPSNTTTRYKARLEKLPRSLL